MFEALMRRSRLAAERRAIARAEALAKTMREQVPRGVEIGCEESDVLISGRDIVRRFATDPVLRWLALRRTRS